MKTRYLIVMLFVLFTNHFVMASDKIVPCRDSLPAPILQIIKTKYKDWHVASNMMLNQQDRERFNSLISNSCYGIIRGKFISNATSYALYLLKSKGKSYMNQLIVFQEANGKVNQYVLISSSFAASAMILRKMPSRKLIIDADTGEKFIPSRDIIDLFDPDKGEIAYFWKGGKFITVTAAE